MFAMHARHLLLALILLVYLALATLYAFNVPAWQAPDEPAHFNYVRELATTGEFPVLRMGDYDQATIQLLTSQRFPAELSIASLRYEAHQPPLYYLLAAPVFRFSRGALPALRLLSAVLGGLFIALIYAIGRAIYPGRPALALGAAAFTAFLPMHVAMAASVNNDALAEMLLAATLLLAIRYIKLALLGPRAPAHWDALAIGLLLGLALISKVSAYVAIPVALAAPLIAWYERRRRRADQQPGVAVDRPLFTDYLLILLPALLLALPWYARNAALYGNLDILGRQWHDAVVVGQLRTGELLAQAGLAALLERMAVWSFASFWGVFGWMGVWMDGRIYSALLAFALASAVGCATWIISRRQATVGKRRNTPDATSAGDYELRTTNYEARFRFWALDLLALSALGTLAIYVAYNLGFVQPQGRYLFPALPAIALAVALGWHEVVHRPAAARGAGVVLLGAAGLAGLLGWLRTGVNKWSIAILLASGLAAGAWSLAWPRLGEQARQRLAPLAFALPFVALAALDLVALYAFIVPQLG